MARNPIFNNQNQNLRSLFKSNMKYSYYQKGVSQKKFLTTKIVRKGCLCVFGLIFPIKKVTLCKNARTCQGE